MINLLLKSANTCLGAVKKTKPVVSNN